MNILSLHSAPPGVVGEERGVEKFIYVDWVFCHSFMFLLPSFWCPV